MKKERHGNRVFLIADVLGFSKIVLNSPDPNGQVDTWLSPVKDAASAADLRRKPQLISDTVFAAASDDEMGLKQLVRFERNLLEEGISKSLLVRGAIAHGPFEWGDLTFGKAVIDAHQLECNQDWIGVTCASNLPHVAGLWGPEGVVRYPPPLKQGMIGLHPVVVWKVPTAQLLQAASTAEPLEKKDSFLEWPWLRRLRNTFHLGRHLATLSPDADDQWQRFSGSIF